MLSASLFYYLLCYDHIPLGVLKCRCLGFHFHFSYCTGRVLPRKKNIYIYILVYFDGMHELLSKCAYHICIHTISISFSLFFIFRLLFFSFGVSFALSAFSVNL